MELISEQHAKRYRDWYAGKRVTLRRPTWTDRVAELAKDLNARTVLDYGSGNHCALAAHLQADTGLVVTSYDPGVPGIDTLPRGGQFDLVVCLHALEHIEPERLSEVWADIITRSRRGVLLVVSCEESTKVFPDGTPWHTLVRPQEFWRKRFAGGQEVLHTLSADEFAVVYKW